jgi:hypothetical protein
MITVIERASTDASTCQSVRKNSVASLGPLKKLNGRCSRHSLISLGTRYKPANPTSKIHKKAYLEVSMTALTLALAQPTALSVLPIPLILTCSRLASRIRVVPGRSLRKSSARDVSLPFIVTSKGMDRYRLLTSRCLRGSCLVCSPTHSTWEQLYTL